MSDVNEVESASDLESGMKTKPGSKKKRVYGIALVILIVLVVALLWFFYWLFVSRLEVKTSDAYVHGNGTTISSQVGAPVTSVYVRNGDLVEQGQLIVALDRANAQAELEKAQAALALAVRHYFQLQNKVEQAQTSALMRKTQLTQAASNFQSRYNLLSTGALPLQEIEIYKTQMEEARSTAEVAHLEYGSALSEIIGTSVQTHPLVEKAKAEVKIAYLNWCHTDIEAPIKGFVAARSVTAGELVAPGKVLMEIIPLDSVWVQANFKEGELRKIGVGQPAKLHAAMYGSGVRFDGKVEGVIPGTGASFSLLPAQNATGNWIKVVQRVPVMISLDQEQLASHPLLIGLSMDAKVNVKKKSSLLHAEATGDRVLSTSIYSNEQLDAQCMIQKIIWENSKFNLESYAIPSSSS